MDFDVESQNNKLLYKLTWKGKCEVEARRLICALEDALGRSKWIFLTNRMSLGRGESDHLQLSGTLPDLKHWYIFL